MKEAICSMVWNSRALCRSLGGGEGSGRGMAVSGTAERRLSPSDCAGGWHACPKCVPAGLGPAALHGADCCSLPHLPAASTSPFTAMPRSPKLAYLQKAAGMNACQADTRVAEATITSTPCLSLLTLQGCCAVAPSQRRPHALHTAQLNQHSVRAHVCFEERVLVRRQHRLGKFGLDARHLWGAASLGQ